VCYSPSFLSAESVHSTCRFENILAEGTEFILNATVDVSKKKPQNASSFNVQTLIYNLNRHFISDSSVLAQYGADIQFVEYFNG
jgi:hypothetical protein